MSQFSIPQFVEIEDKIFGPLTLKQFFIFLGGIGLVVLLYKLITTFVIFILFALPVGVATLILTFGQFNGRGMGFLLSALLGYFSEPRSFVFQKDAATIIAKRVEAVGNKIGQGILSEDEKLSRLHKLTYILNQDVKTEEELIKSRYHGEE